MKKISSAGLAAHATKSLTEHYLRTGTRELSKTLRFSHFYDSSRVVKINEDVEPAVRVQFEDSLLCSSHFRIVRFVVPISIVITRDGIFAV